MLNKVLLLDDDSLSLEFMKIFLEDEGFQVYTAHNCAEAREMFYLHRPALAIVDFVLLDGSGIEFAIYAKSICPVRVIMVSGYTEEHLNSNGINTSLLDGILTKPIDFSDLKIAIHVPLDIEPKSIHQQPEA